MKRKSLLLTAALSLAIATPVLAQGGGGGGGGGAGGAAGGAAASGGASAASSGTGTSSAASGGPSAPSGMGTNGTATGAHTNNSPINPNVQAPTPNGNRASTPAASTTGAAASGSIQTGKQNNADRSGITAPKGANSNNNGQMSAAEQARTGVKTLPTHQAPAAVSAPGVGVGHSANGLPIGTPGSGTSNEDQK